MHIYEIKVFKASTNDYILKNMRRSEGYTRFQIFGGDAAIPLVAGLERGGSFSFVALSWEKCRKSVNLPTFV
jgi:hypothetical protein